MDKLIIFARAPRVGQVKTRLALQVGAAKACEIYRELLSTVIQNLRKLRVVQVQFSPADGAGELREFLPQGWGLTPQSPGDLGARLASAFESAFQNGAAKIVVIGSDCPSLKEKDVRDAWRELDQHDLVLGPAADGGYWLIALKKPCPELLAGIPWSTDQVLAKTLAQAKQLGMRIQLLRILSDIDTLKDWQEYQASRKS